MTWITVPSITTSKVSSFEGRCGRGLLNHLSKSAGVTAGHWFQTSRLHSFLRSLAVKYQKTCTRVKHNLKKGLKYLHICTWDSSGQIPTCTPGDTHTGMHNAHEQILVCLYYCVFVCGRTPALIKLFLSACPHRARSSSRPHALFIYNYMKTPELSRCWTWRQRAGIVAQWYNLGLKCPTCWEKSTRWIVQKCRAHAGVWMGLSQRRNAVYLRTSEQ